MYAWALTRGIEFDIKNSGQHYIFTAHNFRAEWWPSTLKLVFNQNYAKAIAIGAEKVMQRIELAIPPQSPKLVEPAIPQPPKRYVPVPWNGVQTTFNEFESSSLEPEVRPAYLDRLLELVEE